MASRLALDDLGSQALWGRRVFAEARPRVGDIIDPVTSTSDGVGAGDLGEMVFGWERADPRGGVA